jgi:glycine cleavage system regulatory protein
MTTLWPQLPDAVAGEEYEKLRLGGQATPGAQHAAQVWSPVGGRVKASDVQGLVDELTQVATQLGVALLQ